MLLLHHVLPFWVTKPTETIKKIKRCQDAFQKAPWHSTTPKVWKTPRPKNDSSLKKTRQAPKKVRMWVFGGKIGLVDLALNQSQYWDSGRLVPYYGGEFRKCFWGTNLQPWKLLKINPDPFGTSMQPSQFFLEASHYPRPLGNQQRSHPRSPQLTQVHQQRGFRIRDQDPTPPKKQQLTQLKHRAFQDGVTPFLGRRFCRCKTFVFWWELCTFNIFFNKNFAEITPFRAVLVGTEERQQPSLPGFFLGQNFSCHGLKKKHQHSLQKSDLMLKTYWNHSWGKKKTAQPIDPSKGMKFRPLRRSGFWMGFLGAQISDPTEDWKLGSSWVALEAPKIALQGITGPPEPLGWVQNTHTKSEAEYGGF